MSDIHQATVRGNKYPYDTATPTKPGTHWAIIAARGVLADLGDRGGVGDALGDIDRDIKQDIVESLAQIINDARVNAEFGVIENIDFATLK